VLDYHQVFLELQLIMPVAAVDQSFYQVPEAPVAPVVVEQVAFLLEQAYLVQQIPAGAEVALVGLMAQQVPVVAVVPVS